jgi:hypothetical protein
MIVAFHDVCIFILNHCVLLDLILSIEVVRRLNLFRIQMSLRFIKI